MAAEAESNAAWDFRFLLKSHQKSQKWRSNAAQISEKENWHEIFSATAGIFDRKSRLPKKKSHGSFLFWAHLIGYWVVTVPHPIVHTHLLWMDGSWVIGLWRISILDSCANRKSLNLDLAFVLRTIRLGRGIFSFGNKKLKSHAALDLASMVWLVTTKAHSY